MNGMPQDVVVIALGARHRGDDAIGPLVAAALRAGEPPCRIVEGCDDTLSLLNAWETAALAIVVDAAVGGAAPGTVHRLDGEDTPAVKDLARCSSHGLGLAEAMRLGRVLGRLPARLVVFAVEAKTFALGAALSAEVAATVPVLVQSIADEVDRFRHPGLQRSHA